MVDLAAMYGALSSASPAAGARHLHAHRDDRAPVSASSIGTMWASGARNVSITCASTP
jgi:hypothetical protein